MVLNYNYIKMLKTLLKRRVFNQSTLYSVTQGQKFFSTTEEPASETPKVEQPEPTKEELASGQAEWGIKYDDECLKFEKEWKQIADSVEKEQMTYLESELSELQRKKVDMLADKVIDLNLFEMRYFHASLS